MLRILETGLIIMIYQNIQGILEMSIHLLDIIIGTVKKDTEILILI
jgi:hypothetical protein